MSDAPSCSLFSFICAVEDDLAPYDPFASAATATAAAAAPKPGVPAFSFTQGTQGTQTSTTAAPSAAAGANSQSGSRKKAKLPRIYFSSRTHSQLAQVVSELKTTEYRPTMSILGSRQHYCIHPEGESGRKRQHE